MVSFPSRGFALVLFLVPVFLFALFGCSQTKYVLLTPEENYSDDPSVVFRVLKVEQAEMGRTSLLLGIENKRESEALPLHEAKASLLGPGDEAMPQLSGPTEAVDPGESRSVTYVFDTTGAEEGTFEMTVVLPGLKIWPVIFSTEKPPDFKPTPDQSQGPQGPRGPGPGGF